MRSPKGRERDKERRERERATAGGQKPFVLKQPVVDAPLDGDSLFRRWPPTAGKTFVALSFSPALGDSMFHDRAKERERESKQTANFSATDLLSAPRFQAQSNCL